MADQKKTEKNPICFRDAQLEAVEAAADATRAEGDATPPRKSGADPGRFRIIASTDAPVPMWGVPEVLKHGPENIRLARMTTGKMPLLYNHDRDALLGIVDKGEVVGGKLVVEGRFSANPAAQQKRRDYDDGILTGASIGYRIHALNRHTDGNGSTTLREVTDWEPLEATLATVGADPDAGSRAVSTEFEVEITEMREEIDPEPKNNPIKNPIEEKRTMAEVNVGENRAEVELKRTQEILAIAADPDYARFVTPEETQRAVRENSSVDAFRSGIVRKIVEENKASKVGTVGAKVFSEASEKDRKRYSVSGFVRSMVNQARPGTFGEDYDASFEREVSNAISKRLGRSTPGVFIPASTFQLGERALGTTGIASGSGQLEITSESSLVSTITSPNVIEMLRNRPRCVQLGAQTLGGLDSVVRIPRQDTAGSWNWVGEGATVSPSDLTTDFVSVQPRRGSTQSAFDTQLLASSSPDVEALVRADFNKIRNLAIDYAALNGPTGGPGPSGILNATGLAIIAPTGTASTYTTAKMLSWADVTDFEEVVAAANADTATSGWMVTPGIRKALKNTPMFAAGYAQPIWMPGKRDPNGIEEGPMGYNAGVTNQLPQNGTVTGYTGPGLHTAIFGDWSQLIFADWGAVEVIYDPYTQAASGAIVLTMSSLHDVMIRHIAAFVAATQVATA